jgi:hypothetical protein
MFPVLLVVQLFVVAVVAAAVAALVVGFLVQVMHLLLDCSCFCCCPFWLCCFCSAPLQLKDSRHSLSNTQHTIISLNPCRRAHFLPYICASMNTMITDRRFLGCCYAKNLKLIHEKGTWAKIVVYCRKRDYPFI